MLWSVSCPYCFNYFLEGIFARFFPFGLPVIHEGLFAQSLVFENKTPKKEIDFLVLDTKRVLFNIIYDKETMFTYVTIYIF